MGYAAGGGNDIMARIAAEKMSPMLGQQIVIENRGGAGGSIATRAVAKAAPDGYTLVLGGTGTLAINPTLYSNVGYDPRKDFAPIGLIGTSALVLVVHPSIPAHNIKELIAYAKANPGKLNYASAGVGSGIHLGAEYFRFGRHRDDACALQGLGAGADRSRRRPRLDVFQLAAAGDRAGKEGKIRALGGDRPGALADLPGAADHRGGRPARASKRCCITASWRRPARRSRSSLSSTRHLRKAVMTDEFKQKLAADGTEPLASTPEEYAADIDKEETKWSAIVKKSGAKEQ